MDDVELREAIELRSEVLPLPDPGRVDLSQALWAELDERPDPLSLLSLEKALDSVVATLGITELLFGCPTPS